MSITSQLIFFVGIRSISNNDYFFSASEIFFPFHLLIKCISFHLFFCGSIKRICLTVFLSSWVVLFFVGSCNENPPMRVPLSNVLDKDRDHSLRHITVLIGGVGRSFDVLLLNQWLYTFLDHQYAGRKAHPRLSVDLQIITQVI